jgi:biopolymer transport protein ExbD
MTGLKRGGFSHGINEFNITPLADVCTVLILVFLVTMPDVLWKGIQVNATTARANAQVVTQRPKDDDDQLLTVAVTPEGLTLNRQPVTLEELGDELARRLAARADKTVVVVPSDHVALGQVVAVLDVAKASGASHLALLDRREERAP